MLDQKSPILKIFSEERFLETKRDQKNYILVKFDAYFEGIITNPDISVKEGR